MTWTSVRLIQLCHARWKLKDVSTESFNLESCILSHSQQPGKTDDARRLFWEGNSAEQCYSTWDQAKASPKYSSQPLDDVVSSLPTVFLLRCRTTATTTCNCNTRWFRPIRLHSALNHLLFTSLTLPITERLSNKIGLSKLATVLVNIFSNSQNFTTWRKLSVLHFSFWRKCLMENWKVYCSISNCAKI